MKTKIIVTVCLIVAMLFIGLLSTGLTVSAKGTEHFSLSDKLSYDIDKVAEDMAKQKDICIAKDGVSQFVVVYPQNASLDFLDDISYFATTMSKITASNIQLIDDGQLTNCPEQAFVIGDTKFSQDIDVSQVKNDGYRIVSQEDRIFIKSTSQNGCVNGIYGFLQDNLDVIFAEEYFDYIPSYPTLYLQALDYVSNPDMALRSVMQYEAYDSLWYRKLRLNSSDIELNNNNKIGNNALDFISPEKYFESNPEYFAYIDGIRQATQLCYSYFVENEQAFDVLVQNIDAKSQNPDIIYIDFSMLREGGYCQCQSCTKEKNIQERSLFELLDKLAKHYPDKIMTTCIYRDSVLPDDMQFQPNFIPRIVIEEMNQNYSISHAGNTWAKNTKSYVEKWSSKFDNIIIVDNVVSDNIHMPYPNYAVQEDNMAFYAQNKAIGVVHKGSLYRESEMARLRTYILSRQLWDNDIDIQQLMAQYLVVVYGQASDEVAKYIDEMSNFAYFLPGNMSNFDSVAKHKLDYLNIGAINSYVALIKKALTETQNDPEVYQRVQRIYMNLMYTRAVDSSINVDKKQYSADTFVELSDQFMADKINIQGDSIEDWYIQFNEKELELAKTLRVAVITLSSVFPTILVGFALMVLTASHNKTIVIQGKGEEDDTEGQDL